MEIVSENDFQDVMIEDEEGSMSYRAPDSSRKMIDAIDANMVHLEIKEEEEPWRSFLAYTIDARWSWMVKVALLCSSVKIAVSLMQWLFYFF